MPASRKVALATCLTILQTTLLDLVQNLPDEDAVFTILNFATSGRIDAAYAGEMFEAADNAIGRAGGFEVLTLAAHAVAIAAVDASIRPIFELVDQSGSIFGSDTELQYKSRAIS